MVGAHQVALFRFRNVVAVALEGIGEDVARALLVEPRELAVAAQENAAQHEVLDALGMVLRVDEGQRRAPEPPNTTHVSMPRCSRSCSMSETDAMVVLSSSSAHGVERPQPLIELDDAPVVWIEVAAVIGLAAAAGPPWMTSTGAPSGLPETSHATVCRSVTSSMPSS